jgi:polygalacturonase
MTTLLDSRRMAKGAENDETPAPLLENVKSFGAVGDALSDDTAAFQRALDAAYKSGGGTVYTPAQCRR